MKKLKYGSKTGLKYFTYDDIQSWYPCYDSSKYLPKDWKGTAIDILNLDNVPFSDRIWVVLRTEICSEKLMRLFAVFCCRDALNGIKNPDPRSVNAANVAERYANGQTTKAELYAAQWRAQSASGSAARSLTQSSARSATRSAAWSVAYSATRSAQLAAWSALESAGEASRWATETRYRDQLSRMLLVEGKERVSNK